MGQVGSGLGECLLREPALGYVLNRADVLQPAILVLSRVSYQVQVLDRLVRHYKAVLVLKIAGGTLRPLYHVPKEGNVFRMDSTTDSFKRNEPARFEFEDAIELVRPHDLSTLDAPGKAAQASEALALGNKRLTTLQLFLCPFAVVDIGLCSIPFECLAG